MKLAVPCAEARFEMIVPLGLLRFQFLGQFSKVALIDLFREELR